MPKRMTRDMRDYIIDKAMRSRLEEAVNAQFDRLNEVAQAALDSYYDAKTQEWIDAAPEGGLLTMSSWNSIRLGDGSTPIRHVFVNSDWLSSMRNASAMGYTFNPSGLKPMRLMAMDTHVNTIYIKAAHHVRKVEAALDKLDQLLRDAREVYATVSQAVNAVNTTKQLEERYPSLVKFLPPDPTAPKAMTVRDEDVVKTLDNVPS